MVPLMGTTATHALRYPASTDNVQLWTHYQNLAEDVDNTLLNRYGVIRRWRRETDKTFTGTEVGVVRIDNIPFKANVFYTVETNSLKMTVVSGETGIVRARLSTSGAATTSSAQIGSAEGNANTAFTPVQSPVLVAEYAPGSDVTGSVLLTLARSGGSGNVTLGGSSTQPILLMVKAWGKNPGTSGVDI
jgi:hypothetical protein